MQFNVLEYLESSVELYPDKKAFLDEYDSITYQELQMRAKGVASFLLDSLQCRNKPILVIADRSINSLISFFGVVYSGNFYVPVDRHLPQKRIETIMRTLQSPAAIVHARDVDILTAAKFNGRLVIFEDAVSETANEARLIEVRKKTIDTDPLYAIFTSGSTGTPKGVLVNHRSVIDLIDNFSVLFGLSEKSVFGNQAPFDFDVSVKDIYSTIKNGASMQVIPRTMFSFPVNLIAYLNERKINTAIWATSALRVIANLNALDKDTPKDLHTIMFSGEVMPNKVLNYWRKNIPEATYVNLYGPTEITCNCTYFIVNRAFSDHEALPIGSPFPNTGILVLNEDNVEAEKGQIGEICVRGTSLAMGYYNNPEKTKEVFCQNPLNHNYPELIYRTGDLGKYNEHGELLFLSRKDYQIKHQGHRVELGEIEITVNALDFIDAACCLYNSKDEKIVLFYQAPNRCDREIMLGIRDYLPKYMLPNVFIHFQQLPLNKNAKIDRTLLKNILDKQSSKDTVTEQEGTAKV